MLVTGAKLNSTKIQRLERPNEGGRGVYNNKMAIARLKNFGLMMRMTSDQLGCAFLCGYVIRTNEFICV